MSAWLHIQHVTKSYGLHTVLNDVSLLLHPGERVGLVGANGVGKSTLLKIAAGEITPDSGRVVRAPDMATGYLRQVILGRDDAALGVLLNEAVADMRRIEVRLRELEAMMTGASGDLAQLMAEHGDLLEVFERRGGYTLDHRQAEVLSGLGIAHLELSRRFGSLSGGEKARVGLAMLLLASPELLLLDEPTNHLDYRSADWLEAYIGAHRGALLIVSHDRHFLNRTVGAVVEIDEFSRKTQHYTGDYESYRRAKAAERAKWRADYAAQQQEIRVLRLEAAETARRNDNYRAHTDNDKLLRNAKRAKHQATVSQRVRDAEVRLSRLLADPIPEPPDDLHFDADLDVDKIGSRLPLRAVSLVKCFGSRAVLGDVSLDLMRASRVVIVGENGAGKSTLLRILAGLDTPDSGSVQVNPGVRIGWLDQEQRLVSGDLTLFEAYGAGLPDPPKALQARLIKSGLFRYTDFDKPVRSLSSGELRKLHIARLIASRANLLILDEPTNDISLEVLEGLEAALRSFPGAVIAASHDRYFIRQFVGAPPGGEIWELRDGVLLKSGLAAYAGVMT
jgi:macrolide transport system ATP-binding/permease protein